MPALAVFVPCYPWIGLNGIAAIVAVALSKTTRGAVTERASDPALDAMARVSRLPAWQRLRHVTLPQLLAFLVRMVRNRLTSKWKVVLVTDFCGRLQEAGFRIHLCFQRFDIVMVLTNALFFVAVLPLFKNLAHRPPAARAGAWRRRAEG